MLLRAELGGQRYRQLAAVWNGLPASTLWTAATLTIAAYAVLVGYEFLAPLFVGRRIAGSALAVTSFVANALGNTFGNTLITGAAVRLWTYAAAGLSNAEIGRVVVFVGVGANRAPRQVQRPRRAPER